VPRDSLVDRPTATARLLDVRRSTVADVESVAVGLDAIAGRTVAGAVEAPRTVPPVDFATMDGFAVDSTDDGPLTVVGGVTPADDPPSIGPGETVRIATGAPLPPSADAVVPVEAASVTDGELAAPSIAPGANRYPAGATAEAGERLFAAGERLAARHAALLRDVGVDSVTVRRRLSVGILATGTEIHEGRQPDRDSETLANLVRGWGHDPALLGSVPDDASAVRERIERAAAAHDVVLTSGGTSVGSDDYVTSVLADHDVAFSGVTLRPGRPVTAATVDGSVVCGLPGKPVAAYVAALLVLRPLFTGCDRTPTVRADPVARVDLPAPDYEYAIPVDLDDGSAEPVGRGGSLALYDERFVPGRVASSTRVALADGLVVTADPLVPGRSVDVVTGEVLG
jgi:molybdopterin molybdotransferase